ncbi:uncharacterized protein PAC_12387 [Phialocephala subalpina]|uniref:Exodeoxyribonuclease X-like C-terminal domain-containing protein n=1 Tax=Phialocephala subalpina TaxID=576137 RepID=A0A1L7XBR0_9HELO|nr:uncharacterized protein PAC_12387 [Phialocephala subalpina]
MVTSRTEKPFRSFISFTSEQHQSTSSLIRANTSQSPYKRPSGEASSQAQASSPIPEALAEKEEDIDLSRDPSEDEESDEWYPEKDPDWDPEEYRKWMDELDRTGLDRPLGSASAFASIPNQQNNYPSHEDEADEDADEEEDVYIFNFGKHRNKALHDVSRTDPGYIAWLERENVAAN